jgi:hypothetical protein
VLLRVLRGWKRRYPEKRFLPEQIYLKIQISADEVIEIPHGKRLPQCESDEEAGLTAAGFALHFPILYRQRQRRVS